MTLDPALWSALEDHGVCPAHLEMLLRALETQRNGSLAWHYVHGRLTQVDLRVTVPARSYEVARVSAALFEGDGVVR